MEMILGGLGFSPLAAGGAFLNGVAQWAFFKLIFEFLDDEVAVFRDNMLGESLTWVSGVALILLAMWIFFQAFRIVTGQSRDSMMVLVTNSLRSVLVLTIATSMAMGGSDLYEMFSDKMPKEINQIVTGDDESPADSIDDALQVMQLAMIGIDSIAATNENNKGDKDRAIWLTGIGVAGPAIVGGAMLLLYKIALALFIGLGPLFVLSLLFEQTKQLFSRWLYYGIGTMFSLAVLSFMVSVAMKLIGAVAAAFVAQYLVAMAGGGGVSEGISSMAMQQGGLGLILTVLLVTTPPMAAQFFQGTLGQFSAYSMFGVTGRQMSDYAQQGRTAHGGAAVARTDNLPAGTKAIEPKPMLGQGVYQPSTPSLTQDAVKTLPRSGARGEV
ncbi:TrbL/VirB6 family protein [Lysobacter humi (ex Lee et al. 2017)]